MKSHPVFKGFAGLLVLLAMFALPTRAGADDDPSTLAAEAFALRMAGQVDEAVELLESGLEDDPAAGIVHFELARTRLLLLDIAGMYEEALAAVACAPSNNDFRYFSAMASAYALIDAAHHGDQERMVTLGRESLDQLQTILAADPQYHQARFLLVQLSTEMAPQLGLDVEDPEIHVALLEKEDPILGARARCCLVDKKEQEKLWRQVLADHPADSRALNEAAAGFIQAGDLVQAEKCLHDAMAMDPQMTYGLLDLGLAYFMRQDWERAAALTREYLDTEPYLALKAYATGRLAKIYEKMGEPEEARKYREAARELDPHVWPTVMPPPEEIFQPI